MDGGGREVVRSGGAFVDVRGLKVVACYILELGAHTMRQDLLKIVAC